MRYLKFAALVGFAAVLTAAAPEASDLSRLSVMRSVRPGLWVHTFATIPKNPAVANTTEKGCISQAQLNAMMRQALTSSGNSEQCPLTIDSDTMTMARFTIHCKAVKIPQLGVNAPAGSLPGTIVKSGNEEHWVVSVKTPPVPGKVPAATWRHEYRRLGSCPG